MKVAQKRFGILLTKSIELPYDNIFEQTRDEKLNAEVAHTGFRIVNSASDFAFIETFADQSADFSKVERLESGSEISLFKTITQGTIRWEGTISLDRTNYHHGYQRGLTEKEWVTMFHSTLPARLDKKGGRSLFGALEAFMETGTEGPVWMITEYGKNGYAALEGLDDGDKLTVFSCVFDGEVDWNGRLSLGEDSPFSISLGKSADFKYQLMRKTYHMDTAQWMWLTFQNRPCAFY
jgi:hypothetical protein